MQDVALKVVRWSDLADGTFRLVLEFDYLLPAPVVTDLSDRIVVEVSKEYVQANEQLVTPGYTTAISAGPAVQAQIL